MKNNKYLKKISAITLITIMSVTGSVFTGSVVMGAEKDAGVIPAPEGYTSEAPESEEYLDESLSSDEMIIDDDMSESGSPEDPVSQDSEPEDTETYSEPPAETTSLTKATGQDITEPEKTDTVQYEEKNTGGIGTTQSSENTNATLNGWKLVSGKYYYYKKNVKYTGWHYMTSAEGEKKAHWSYFGKDGALRTGWVQLGKGTSEPDGNSAKHWSYFGENGWLRTGWVKLGKGTSNPDSNSSEHWSYFGENGWLRTGWIQLGKGTSEPDGNSAKHWSYFGENGWLRTFWQQLGQGTPNKDGNTPAHFSYFGENGWLRTGNATINGKSYTFDSKGWLLVGFVNASDANKNTSSDPATGTTSDKQLIADGCYRISPVKNTGYSIDVWGGIADDNTKIWSYANNDTAAQFFQIKHLGGNIYSIKTGASIYASGWDISGGKAVAGASLVQKKYTGSTTQKWKIVSSGNGSYTFKPVSADGLAVDIEGGNLSEGTVKLAKYTGNNTQQFKISKASGFLIRNGRKYYFNQNGDKPMIGIDVSAWSENVDWAKVKADGIEFAIIRASHRGGQVDKYAARNMSECTRLGIPFGVYCYSYATTNAEADHEVNTLLSVIKNYNPTLGVFIDVEDNATYEAAFGNIYSANARRKITDITKRMVSRVQNAGYLAGVYGNDPYLNQILYLDEMPNARWIARYFNNNASDTNVLDLADKGYKIWQFTDKGTVNGVPNSGNADLNTLIEKYW